MTRKNGEMLGNRLLDRNIRINEVVSYRYYSFSLTRRGLVDGTETFKYRILKDCLLRQKGWKDPGTMDSSGSDSVPKVHQRFRRMEHGHRLLGGDVLRRKTVLELV